MPVTIPPGEIVLTRTPALLISAATLRDKWMTAAFNAL
jgi:hypothetical protein